MSTLIPLLPLPELPVPVFECFFGVVLNQVVFAFPTKVSGFLVCGLLVILLSAFQHPKFSSCFLSCTSNPFYPTLSFRSFQKQFYSSFSRSFGEVVKLDVEVCVLP